MATLILGTVGAVAGALIAGPAGAVHGAMLGFSIGATAGSFIDQANQHFYTADMGKTYDLVVTVSSYGTSIPQCWGQTKTGGIVTWGTDLVEHEKDVNSGGGGSGGPKVTTREYTYTVSLDIVICKGNQSGRYSLPTKILANNITIYDSTASVTKTKTVYTPHTDPTFGSILIPTQVTTTSGNTLTNITDSGGNVVGVSIQSILFPNAKIRFYYGAETQPADPLIISSAGNTAIPAGADNPASRGTCHCVIQDLLLTDFGNAIPQFQFLLDSGTTYISDYVTDVLTQVGLTTAQIDTTQIAGKTMTGMIIQSRVDAKTALQPILDAYHIDAVDVNGKVTFVPRGGAPVATITWADLGYATIGSDSTPSIRRIVKSRIQDLNLPKRVDVGYFSPSIKLQTATQSAIRQSARIDNYVSIQYPLTLTDAEAFALAQRLLWLAWVEREKFAASVSPKFAYLSAADVVMLQTDAAGTMKRVRITMMETGLNGEIKMEFVKDDDGALTQTSAPATNSVVGTEDIPASPTTFFAWSGKELRDEDTVSAGIYVAATGDTDWKGCAVLVSVDGGSTYSNLGSIANRAVFGSATSALPITGTVNSNGFDTTSSLAISVNSPGTLITTSETSVTNGQGNYGLVLSSNTAADNSSDYEVFGFATATLTGTNAYSINDLLRKQRSTLDTGHTPVDMFVQLDNSLTRIPLASKLIGTTVLVKCVSPGEDPSVVTPQTVYVAQNNPAYVSPSTLTSTTNSALAANKTPFWRTGSYLGSGLSAGSSIDATYFQGGTNFPSGKTQRNWPWYCNGPGGSFRYETPGVEIAIWGKLGVKNTTGAAITANVWIPTVDNSIRVRWNGTDLINDTSSGEHALTFTVAANQSALLEFFYFNAGSGVYDPSNQGVCDLFTDVLSQIGIAWYDADNPGTSSVVNTSTVQGQSIKKDVINVSGSGPYPLSKIPNGNWQQLQTDAGMEWDDTVYTITTSTSGGITTAYLTFISSYDTTQISKAVLSYTYNGN